MEKQSNTMQCIPSFFVLLDKIATFVKSVYIVKYFRYTYIWRGWQRVIFAQRVWISFYFTYFIVRGALFTVFRAKKIAVTSNLKRIGDLRTRLKINWKPVCLRRDFVRKYDRYQSLLLCTPLVYMHEYGPYKSIKKCKWS
jgi:hypothetical protein